MYGTESRKKLDTNEWVFCFWRDGSFKVDQWLSRGNEDTKQGHQKTHLVNGRGRWETQLEGRSPGTLTESLQQKGVPGQIDGSHTVTKKEAALANSSHK